MGRVAMNEREQKSFIRFLAGEWRESCREVFAYQLLIAVMKKEGAIGLDEMLAEYRHSPAVEKKLDEQFDAVEKFLPTPDEANADREILELLARWKPAGRPN